ncbi:MAG TPA: universal stress protein [Thermoanaerobaculia bacterium]|jgi:nucleotide-binding universal stress UspA family protein|nr:universal stress protein [Thermoanaerobaculia bacterium]
MSDATRKIQTILVGTDLDRESESLVGIALALARAAGARIHVAYAFNPPIGFLSELGAGFDPAILAAEEQRSAQALTEQIRHLGIGPAELHGQTVRTGAPHRVLPELAEEIGADLVIVGATAGGRLHRRLGSTADRVLRRGTCPILVVRGDLRIPPRRILAPLDLSPLAADSFRNGLDLVAQLGGGPPEVEALFILSVVQRQVAPQFTPEQVDRFAADELRRFVEAHAGAAAGEMKRKVRAGNTREEIFAEIADFRPDLVLLGTHGTGGFDRLVIGSVAADVSREAPCSVLVVPPKEVKE